MPRQTLKSTRTLVVLEDVVQATLSTARKCSKDGECVLYWVGDVVNRCGIVSQVIHPHHSSSPIRATVTSSEVARIISQTHSDGHYLLAQIHTHLGLAFHSYTDDTNPVFWEAGLRSVVIPGFGNIDSRQFTEVVRVFIQVSPGCWTEGSNKGLRVLRASYDRRLVHRTNLLAKDMGFQFKSYLASATSFPVCVVVDGTLGNTVGGQLLATSTINMLVRMGFVPRILLEEDPEIDEALPMVGGLKLSKSVDYFLASIRPSYSEPKSADYRTDPEVAVHIGAPFITTGAQEIHVDGTGWVASVSSKPLLKQELLHVVNPIGPLLAATFAVSEVFKTFLKRTAKVSIPSLDDLVFSALDYSIGSVKGMDKKLESLVLPPTTLVGCGAIGSGFIYGLSSLEKTAGELRLVDHDRVEETNLGRYNLFTVGHLGRKKTDVMSSILEGRVKVESHPKRYHDVGKTDSDHVVVCAVDNVETRWRIQKDNPATILNSGMHGDSFRVTRHEDEGSGPCLGCAYPEHSEPVTTHSDYPASPYVSLRAGILLFGEFVKHVDESLGQFSLKHAYIVNSATSVPSGGNAFIGFSKARSNCPLNCGRAEGAEVGRKRNTNTKGR